MLSSLDSRKQQREEKERTAEIKMRGGFFERPLVNLIELLLYDTDDIDSGTDYMYGILQMVLWVIDLSTTTTRSITSDTSIKLT